MEKGKVVLSYKNSLLFDTDIGILQRKEWLNDRLIGFAFEELEEHFPNCLFFCPEVTQLLKLGTESDARAVLVSVDFSEKDLLFLPLNNCSSTTEAGGTHWSLLIYSLKHGRFYHADSEGSLNHSSAVNFVKKLSPILDSDSKVAETKCVKQDNGYDCGIHVISNAEHFLAKFVQMGRIPNDLTDMKLHLSKREDLFLLIQKLSNPA